MQGRGLIKFLSIVLGLVCMYYVVNTYLCSQVEKEAVSFAENKYSEALKDGKNLDSVRLLIKGAKHFYLDSMANEKIYLGPISFFGNTYKQCRETKLNLGLDLQGGMSLTLQVSLVDVIKTLSNDARSTALNKAIVETNLRQRSSGEDFLSLFGLVWEEVNSEIPMARLFTTRDNHDEINPNSDNAAVLGYLRKESSDAIANTENVIKTRIDKFGVIQPNIYRAPGSDRIYIELAGIDNPEKIKRILQSSAKLEFWNCYDNKEVINNLASLDQSILKKNQISLGLDTASNNEVKEKEISDEIINNNIDTADINNEDALLADFEEIEDSLETKEGPSAPSLFTYLYPSIGQNNQIFPGSVVGRAKLKDTSIVNSYISSKEAQALLPRNIKLLWGAKPSEDGILSLHAIKLKSNRKPALDGDVITDVEIIYENGNAGIQMVMNAEGAKKWRRVTAIASKDPNNKECIAIVLDGRVYSAPTVQEEIPNGISSITGRFTTSEANDLILILKNGRLPAKTMIIEENIVGPSLGKASINAGLMSLLIGLALVLVFMFFYYNKGGAISDIALLINIFFILGVLAAFNATLTLPGIAGLVLTIGMSVDANVIIFERIREELRNGESIKASIRQGFNQSYSAIIDANLTTLFTGIILFIFGSGPIKGFATVLLVGILMAYLTAVLITRVILEHLLDAEKAIEFQSKSTAKWFVDFNIDFVTKRKMSYVISALIIGAGIFSMTSKGFELGVDFNGGRSYIVKFDQDVATDAISEKLKIQFDGKAPVVKTFGENNQIKVTTSYLVEDNSAAADETIKSKLYEGLQSNFASEISSAEFFNDDQNKERGLLQSTMVGPTIADDFQRSATYATIFGLAIIFLYILFRFSWQYGAGAVIAVIHDVFIVLSLFSIFKNLLPFSLEIDQAFIAALLTIIGYSINDTVVIFDRIREYLQDHKTSEFKSVINAAVNRTLSRTLMTSITTLFVVLVLFILGGEVIRGFAFALLIGVISGTYSSIFIATPTVVDLPGNKR